MIRVAAAAMTNGRELAERRKSVSADVLRRTARVVLSTDRNIHVAAAAPPRRPTKELAARRRLFRPTFAARRVLFANGTPPAPREGSFVSRRALPGQSYEDCGHKCCADDEDQCCRVEPPRILGLCLGVMAAVFLAVLLLCPDRRCRGVGRRVTRLG